MTTAFQGALYSYQVIASDADSDVLSYALAESPAGMSIGADGLVEWPSPEPGSYSVVVQVFDGNGGVAEQAYTLTVSDNLAPEFVQIPALNAPQGEVYRSIGQAVDPDGGPVSITLQSGPVGATLNDLGDGRFELVFTPGSAVGALSDVVIRATDDVGAVAILNLAITTTGGTTNRSHLGTDFWLAFPVNYPAFNTGLIPLPLDDPRRLVQIEIGAPDGATGTVEVPGLGIVELVDIQQGGSQRIDFPIDVMLRGQSQRMDVGIHVTTDRPVTVVGINWGYGTSDAFLALPTTSLGSNYTITGYRDNTFANMNSDRSTTRSTGSFLLSRTTRRSRYHRSGKFRLMCAAP